VAVAWSVSLLVTHLTLLFVPLLVRSRRWGVLATGLIVLILGSAPYFLAHPADFRLFIDWALGQDLVTNTGNACFQNLVYHSSFSRIGVHVVTWAIIALSTALTFFPARVDELENLCLWTATYFLIYAHVWEHHYVMLVPPLVLLVLVKRHRAAIGMGLLAALPSPFVLFAGHWNWFREVIYLAAKSAPAVWLYLDLLLRHVRPDPQPARRAARIPG